MYNAKLQKLFVTLSPIYDKEVIYNIRVFRNPDVPDDKLWTQIINTEETGDSNGCGIY
ncbi:hypothetical protein JCM17724A_17480 [Prevotella fusca JCM 17724]